MNELKKRFYMLNFINYSILEWKWDGDYSVCCVFSSSHRFPFYLFGHLPLLPIMELNLPGVFELECNIVNLWIEIRTRNFELCDFYLVIEVFEKFFVVISGSPRLVQLLSCTMHPGRCTLLRLVLPLANYGEWDRDFSSLPLAKILSFVLNQRIGVVVFQIVIVLIDWLSFFLRIYDIIVSYTMYYFVF